MAFCQLAFFTHGCHLQQQCTPHHCKQTPATALDLLGLGMLLVAAHCTRLVLPGHACFRQKPTATDLLNPATDLLHLRMLPAAAAAVG